MYVCTWVRTSSRGKPSRLVKNQLTSGCVNRYADVEAETPEATPARSAAVQFGGLGSGHRRREGTKQHRAGKGAGADCASYRTPSGTG